MQQKNFVVAAIIFSSLLWFRSDGFAQSVNPASDTSALILDYVIITANKSPKKLSETGKVVTVIDRKTLERSSGKDLSQLLNEQSGVVVAGANSNPSKDKSIFLRGAKSDHTLILIDGIPVYDPSGSGSNFDLRLIPIEHIERIEILKGSQSTLYGSDAIAGVINIITKKSGPKQIGVFGNFSYGTYSTFKANTGVRGNEGIMDYNISYSYFNTNGINEATNENNIAGADKDGYKQHGVLANLGFQLKDNWKLSPYLRHSNFDGKLDYDAFADDKDYTYKARNFQGGVRSELKLKKNVLTLNYNYNEVERKYLNDSGYVNPVAFDMYSRGKYNGKEHFTEAIFTGDISRNLQFVSGFDYRSSNTNQDYLSLSSFGEYTDTLSKDSAKQQQYGLYASLLFSEKIFHAEAGARFNHHTTYGSKWTYNFNPFVFIHKQLKIFANFSSAYKTPTLYQLYSIYGNKALKPESAITYEGGLQYFHPKQTFNGRIVIYKRNVTDAIAFYTDPNTFRSFYINQDTQKDWGFEIEPIIRINEKVQIQLYYAYTDGKITTDLNGKDTSYFNLFRRPKHSGAVRLNYLVTKALFFNMNVQTFGERKDIDYRTFPASYTDLSAYTLLNAYAEYRFNQHIKLFADFKNITNTHYTEILGYNTQGPTVQAGASINL